MESHIPNRGVISPHPEQYEEGYLLTRQEYLLLLEASRVEIQETRRDKWLNIGITAGFGLLGSVVSLAESGSWPPQKPLGITILIVLAGLVLGAGVVWVSLGAESRYQRKRRAVSELIEKLDAHFGIAQGAPEEHRQLTLPFKGAVLRLGSPFKRKR